MTAVAQNAQTRPILADASRVVIKIGSSLLIDADTGRLNLPWLESLADEIQRICKRGQQVLVVSSGAIALGSRYLGLSAEQRRLEDLQAAAASGQILLAHSYQNLLDQRGLKIAQILLTLEDTENRRRYLNARSTLETLLRLGVVPVINENDTVATQEIRYGDNDRLAARVAEMTSADCLLLLSDVDGLYESDPAVKNWRRQRFAWQQVAPRRSPAGTACGQSRLSNPASRVRGLFRKIRHGQRENNGLPGVLRRAVVW